MRAAGPIGVGLVLGLLLISTPAAAQGVTLVVGQSLALGGLVGGLVAGCHAGWRASPARAIWPAFGIYLGLLSMVASTRAGDMGIVPLALVLGAAAGLLPFAAAYFAVRWCWGRVRDRRGRRN